MQGSGNTGSKIIVVKKEGILHAFFFANVFQTASVTIGFGSCRADFSTVVNQSVAEIIAFFGRYDIPEGHFYLFRIFDIIYQSHAVYQADAVCIGDDGRFAKHITHDQICTFSAHSG